MDDRDIVYLLSGMVVSLSLFSSILIRRQFKDIKKVSKLTDYWRQSALSLNSDIRRRANFHNPKIGGDTSEYKCIKCDGKTEFEEYASHVNEMYTDLGLLCLKCGHREEPPDFYERFHNEG